MLIAGGSNGTTSLASSDIVDFATRYRTPGRSMTYPREELTATTLLDWRVLVVGGRDGPTSVAAAEMLNGTSFTTYRQPRRTPAGTYGDRLPHNNQVLIVGGMRAQSGAVTAELYTPWDGSFGATGWPAERHVKAQAAKG